MTATDFFGEPFRPSGSRQSWWLLECGHFGKAQLRGRDRSVLCEICARSRRAVRKEANA